MFRYAKPDNLVTLFENVMLMGAGRADDTCLTEVRIELRPHNIEAS
ncbi:MAG: hypothetical protein QNJ22_16280 [Desulfosarcinaceae bacterium]|nr:hypothetical protein [Desulfosarcinaceae bacterium]